MQEIVDSIKPYQRPTGEFASMVYLPFGELQDSNCFVTALVLRELSLLRKNASQKDSSSIEDMCRRACGYLIRSGYPVYQNSYSFYPHHRHPFWMRSPLYPDADDTAIIALELVRHGYKSPETIHYIAERYFDVYRAVGKFTCHMNKDWHREGVFLTWFTKADIPNPIDCCVNANVVAMLAANDLKQQDGYFQAIGMIKDAVDWASQDEIRLRDLTPYYPCPLELYYAVAHAVESGADELLTTRNALSFVLDTVDVNNLVPQLCSSVNSHIFWKAEVIYKIRRFNMLQEVSNYGRHH